MAPRSFLIDDDLNDYLLAHTTAADAVQLSLITATQALGDVSGMQIAVDQGNLLTLLARLVGARRAIEVGTFTGYSSICLARGLAPGGRLLCCDVSESWTAIAREHWARAGLEDRIELRIAPAAETLAALPYDPPIDLAFVDADKEGYPTYIDLLAERLRPGGVIAVDNTLWGGAVADPSVDDPTTELLRGLNADLVEDPRFDTVLLPLGDGLTLLRRP